MFTAHRSFAWASVLMTALVAVILRVDGAAQVRLRSESDRHAFRAWFLVLADAEFYRRSADVTDCAALVRHAVREALRPHTEEWLRQARLPLPLIAPDVSDRPRTIGGSLALFMVHDSPARYAEFADANTIVRFNTAPLGRDVAGARPGDLLYFRQSAERMGEHLMVFVGPSALSPEANDWVVYHTGPDMARPEVDMQRPASGAAGSGDAGEVRKVRLADSVRHPSARWRPLPANPAFIGVFRFLWLS